MTQPPVTLVTRTARAADQLTDADYRDIYDELRQQHSLRQFVQISNTQYSIAWWSKFEHNDIALTRQARNELRAAVGLPPLPLTVEQATAAIDPDAAIYQVGNDAITRVVLIAHPTPLTMHLNGTLDVDDLAPQPRVTPVTRPRNRRTVSIQPSLWQRLNATRRAQNVTWDQLLQRVLEETINPEG